MEIDRPNAKALTPEEIQHLEKLRTVVQKALGDGNLSTDEIEHIKLLIWSDGKVSYEELRIVHETIAEVMGDITPTMEWRSYG